MHYVFMQIVGQKFSYECISKEKIIQKMTGKNFKWSESQGFKRCPEMKFNFFVRTPLQFFDMFNYIPKETSVQNFRF